MWMDYLCIDVQDAKICFPIIAEVMLTWSITMLRQPGFSEQSNTMACSFPEVPWKPRYVHMTF